MRRSEVEREMKLFQKESNLCSRSFRAQHIFFKSNFMKHFHNDLLDASKVDAHSTHWIQIRLGAIMESFIRSHLMLKSKFD